MCPPRTGVRSAVGSQRTWYGGGGEVISSQPPAHTTRIYSSFLQITSHRRREETVGIREPLARMQEYFS
jgi:hypothetical protein